ncbi:MAG: glycosyltransferase family 4 protein [Hyphomicrobiaceae bacterium]|nr:glycosyltransferase family 4 protein [Hyphomicrobiaceae bacterium]
MSKLRIMHTLGAAQAGGAETFFIRLVAALAEHPDIDLLPVVREGSWASQQLCRRGIRHETAAFGGWADRSITRTTARRMRAHAEAFRPHVIQSWMNRATAHMPAGPWTRVARLGGYYDMKYYRGTVDELVGITQALCDYFIENGWPADRVTWLDNFAETPTSGWEARRQEMRAQYGIPEHATALLLAGRLHKVKGVDLTLRAIAPLPDNIWVIAAGNGPEEDALRALSRDLGIDKRVVFTGWVNDISVPAAAADYWLAPSRWEPMGSTVLDAWAHGKPLIASRAAGPASLIDEGKTGLLVDVGDVETLRAAIVRLTQDPALRAALAENGYERYVARHSKTVIVDAYLKYYRKLIGGNAVS